MLGSRYTQALDMFPSTSYLIALKMKQLNKNKTQFKNKFKTQF